ncbi:hypothetical protein IJH16_01435 [Candidatus Saccharibacteria bacterium]|nr:hypothetical protein [Candidatus Saccharibacteria bacterium]
MSKTKQRKCFWVDNPVDDSKLCVDDTKAELCAIYKLKGNWYLRPLFLNEYRSNFCQISLSASSETEAKEKALSYIYDECTKKINFYKHIVDCLPNKAK